MKKNETTVMILITTLSLSANAEYYSIVKGLNKTYLDGNINISYSEWLNDNAAYDCYSNISSEDLYYNITSERTETCNQAQKRTKTTTTHLSDGSQKVVSELEFKEIITSNTDSIIGTHLESNCKDIKDNNYSIGDAFYSITYNETIINVKCDMTTDGGGWTVFQNRESYSDFYRTWNEYKNGFGDETNFWLGNDIINKLTQQNKELYIELEHHNGTILYARYSNFSIGNESNLYKLNVSGFSGSAGDSFSVHNNMNFTTKDRDYDRYYDDNCASLFSGAWWYNDCHLSNLNGYYFEDGVSGYANGVAWYEPYGHYYSHKRTKMMIR